MQFSCKISLMRASSSAILTRVLILNEQMIAGVGILPQTRYSPRPLYPLILVPKSHTSDFAECTASRASACRSS